MNEQWSHNKLTFSLSMAHKHLRKSRASNAYFTPVSLHVEDRGCGSGSIKGSECLITALQPIILTRDIFYILSNIVIISVNREGRREGTLNHGSTFIWVEGGGNILLLSTDRLHRGAYWGLHQLSHSGVMRQYKFS